MKEETERYTEEQRKAYISEIQKLIDYFPDSAFSSISRNKKLSHLKDFVLYSTSFLDEFYNKQNVKLHWCTRWYYLKNGIKQIIRCKNKNCNKPLLKKFQLSEKYIPEYCSDKCSANDGQVVLKRKQTSKRLYGNENFVNVEKSKDTRYKKNFGEYDSLETRIKKSIGIKQVSGIIVAKGKATRKALYNNENFNNREKASQTYFNKTGYRNPSQNPTVKRKKENTSIANYGCSNYLGTKQCHEQLHQKNLEKYGSELYFTSSTFKQKMKDPVFLENKKKKEYVTKKKNNSFRASKPEDEAYWMLKFIFPKLQRQYRSEDYPFNADFYDPMQPKVRFEFNGTWTHGFHAFNEENSDDLLSLMKMLSKGTKYYMNAVSNWLVRDPMKREVAKQNGITLIEFWNLDDVREFVLNYFQP